LPVLAALTQDVLRQKPAGGAVFAFHGRRGDRLKLLYWEGQGFCLYYKVLLWLGPSGAITNFQPYPFTMSFIALG